jgi:hypothetical protein
MKDGVVDDSRCPFELLCKRACSGDYKSCYEETSRTGINSYGEAIKHPHIVVMYEGKREGKPRQERKCIIATVSGCDHETLAFYRSFRDDFMSRTMIGECLVDSYYAVSPSIVVTVVRFEIVRKLVKETLKTLKIVCQKSGSDFRVR